MEALRASVAAASGKDAKTSRPARRLLRGRAAKAAAARKS